MMYSGSLAYFANLQAQSSLITKSSNAVSHLLTSNGIFGYEPKVNYLYGIPRTITNGGVTLDIPMNLIVNSLDNNKDKTINTTINIGTISSALEHQVPESMFNEVKQANKNYTHAISAIKALQLADQQKQKIYKITKQNINTILPKLNLTQSTKQAIQSYINNNRYVITHTDKVSVKGYKGAGYIAIDPTTGEGAYMISGGMNGGSMPIDKFALFINALVEGINYLINKLLIMPSFENAIEDLCASEEILNLQEKFSDFIYSLSSATMVMSFFSMSSMFANLSLFAYGNLGSLLLMTGMLHIARYYTRMFLALKDMGGMRCH